MASCANYGALVNGICDCPTGLGGSNCSSILCDNPIASSTNRTVLESTAANTGCESTGQCTSGFNGLDCNICTSNDACSAAVTTYGRVTSDVGTSSGLTAGSDSVQCSKSPYTYTSGFIECDVINPTLQAVFPGTTTLKFQKNVRPSLSLSDVYGGDNTTFAQLWYSSSNGTFPQEQFYCGADSCVQANDTSSSQITWSCSNLQCTCISGTSFCGPPLDLTNVINGLSGTLDIDCAADGGTCNFKQATLQSLFGQNGLGLSGCTFGECVSASTVQELGGGTVVTNSGNGLSSGVIAGLAVVGALVLGLLGLLLLGLLAQRKARRGGKRDLDHVAAAGVSWADISYTLPAGKGQSFLNTLRRRKPSLQDTASSNGLVAHEKEAEAPSRRGDGSRSKLILDGISGSLPFGGFMAILGPSGAGKSTFVDILAGKRKVGNVYGDVSLVCADGTSPSSVRIGYVDQADVLPANLTVKEALMFAAKLRLPESIPREEQEQRVWEILGQLGLRDIAHSRVGSGERRGISGGERRRLSIGLELIAKPSILILDEPTSGLDSVSAAKVVQVLRSLSVGEGGSKTTIIATIHQPSSQIFHAFDSVLLLSSKGTQVYHGPAASASSYFAQQGHHCPHDWNPADYLLELASGPAVGTANTTLQNNGHSNAVHDPHSLDMTPSRSHSDDSEAAKYPPVTSSVAVKQRNAKPATTLLTQFQVLSGREYLNLKRDWSLIVMHNAVAAIVGLFVGGLYFQVDTTISGFQNRIGSLFFLGALVAFSALSALSNLIQVRSLFLRERSSSYYGPVMWMLSRVVWDIVPLRILPTIILGTITYWMVGLSGDAAHFFKFLLILVEFTAAVTLWNLLLAVSITQSGVAILVSNVLNLAMLAYAGFFVNLSKIPAVLRWIQWLNPLKYALEALAVNEVSGGLLIDDVLSGVRVQVNAQLIMELLFGFKPSAYYRDVLVLFAWIAGFGALLTVAVLRLREIR